MTNKASDSVGLEAAAALLLCSTSALQRKARAGLVPGAKIGRRWVFVRQDLVELIREQARGRSNRHRNVQAALSSMRGLEAARLDAALRRLKHRPQAKM